MDPVEPEDPENVYCVYMCGHVDVLVDHDNDYDFYRYEYIRQSCGKPACQQTDPATFVQNMRIPSSTDWSVLADLRRELEQMRQVDIPMLLHYADHMAFEIGDLQGVADEDVVQLLRSEDEERRWLIEDHFFFAKIDFALTEAWDHSLKREDRFIFDFCASRAYFHFAEALHHYWMVHFAVHELIRIDTYGRRPTANIMLMRAHLEEGSDHSATDGERELELLRMLRRRGRDHLHRQMTGWRLARAGADMALFASRLLQPYHRFDVDEDPVCVDAWLAWFQIRCAARRRLDHPAEARRAARRRRMLRRPMFACALESRWSRGRY